MRVLIATSAGPTGAAQTVFDIIRKSALEGGLEVPQGIMWTHGPGCSNMAFDIIGPDDKAERFADAVTMALMPAKWGTTTDSLPDVDTCELEERA